MYKATLNEATSFEIEIGDQVTIDQKPLSWDLEVIAPGYFHLVYENQSYRAEVVKADYSEKAFVIKLNGKEVSVQVQDRFDLLLDQLGMADLANQAVADLKAPMPGLILELMVQEGDKVEKGTPLLILEAMKMENVLKAPGEGTVTKIVVEKGASVEKSQVLIQF